MVWIELIRSVKCTNGSFGIIDDSIYRMDGPNLKRSNLALFATDTYSLPDYMRDIKEIKVWQKHILCISPSSGALVRISPVQSFKEVKFEPKHVEVETVIPKPYMFFGKYLTIQNSIEKWE